AISPLTSSIMGRGFEVEELNRVLQALSGLREAQAALSRVSTLEGAAREALNKPEIEERVIRTADDRAPPGRFCLVEVIQRQVHVSQDAVSATGSEDFQ
ncbi:MAG: hypothetical protein QOD49_3172, partial [Actinomycetota bacterium]|nr:hypothetical protein [Actinomycetota bacterium]